VTACATTPLKSSLSSRLCSSRSARSVATTIRMPWNVSRTCIGTATTARLPRVSMIERTNGSALSKFT
jgi:hypothetical protein